MMTKLSVLTHKAPTIICNRRQFQILLLFQKITNKAWYFMKYHTLFFSKIKEDVAEIAVCCSRDWRFKS